MGPPDDGAWWTSDAPEGRAMICLAGEKAKRLKRCSLCGGRPVVVSAALVPDLH
jgi:hypothetical protein